MESLNDFFAMGGYARFVWGSFAVTALVMIANALLAQRAERRVKQSILKQINHQSTPSTL